MFRNAFVNPEDSKNKSYDEILEEYEKFFSLDEELLKKEDQR